MFFGCDALYVLLARDPQLLSHDVVVEGIVLLGLGRHLSLCVLRARRSMFDDYDLLAVFFPLLSVPLSSFLLRSINFPLTS